MSEPGALLALRTWWWQRIEAIESHLVERQHAANVRVFCLGFAAVLAVMWGLQWWAGSRPDVDQLYRPGWWAPSLAWQGALIGWLLAMAAWGKRVRHARGAHPWAVQLALVPALCGIVVLGVAHGLHDTPVPMLILNVLVFSRGLFAWREVRWSLGLCVLLVVASEWLTGAGHLPYAPLLAQPVFTGGGLHPWWSVWVRVLFVLAAVLMSLVLFCLAVAVARRRQELETLVSTDALTGLANRREFMTRLAREAHRQARGGRPASIVLFDVDHFKQVNDRWGHPVGDQVLSRIGALLRAHTRDQVDTAARYGGEEFVLLLPDTDVDGACLVAEKIAVRLREAWFDADGQRFQVTQSVGVAQVVEGDVDLALRVADRNLYRAKQAGRDRMVASVAFPEDGERPALAV